MPEFSRTATELKTGPLHVVALGTGTPSVISLSGSFDLHPDIAAGEEMVAGLVAGLLDKGTTRRDRFELATILEERGARVAFGASDLRLRFSAYFLRDDLDVVLDVLGEQLLEPLFDEGELEKLRGRMLGGIRRQVDDTGHRASELLARNLYPPDHPNWMADIATEEAWLAAATKRDVADFHARSFRGNGVRIAVAGDVDPDRVTSVLSDVFGDWSRSEASARTYDDPPPSTAGREVVSLLDRPNLDVRIGHTLPVRVSDPDYEALRLGCFVLGGNFSARLMSRIRDERGLTYGISSGLSGVDVRHGGAWRTSVTLSQDRLDEGIDATMIELERFVSGGVDESEVAEKRETLAGQFQVSLANTSGIAGAFLRTMERGESLERLDAYPDRVRSLSAVPVNEAIRRHLDPARLYVATAGTVSLPG